MKVECVGHDLLAKDGQEWILALRAVEIHSSDIRIGNKEFARLRVNGQHD
jgi:hypothetical protein